MILLRGAATEPTSGLGLQLPSDPIPALFLEPYFIDQGSEGSLCLGCIKATSAQLVHAPSLFGNISPVLGADQVGRAPCKLSATLSAFN
jgi:hypothetical protein